jgi:putative membrane protein
VSAIAGETYVRRVAIDNRRVQIHRVIRFLATAAALWVAARVVPGISHTGTALSLLGVAAVFGVVNTIIAPIVKLLALPFIILTLGLLALVINGLMLLLVSRVAVSLDLGFHVDGFLAALLGSLVISVVSAIITFAFEDDRKK